MDKVSELLWWRSISVCLSSKGFWQYSVLLCNSSLPDCPLSRTLKIMYFGKRMFLSGERSGSYLFCLLQGANLSHWRFCIDGNRSSFWKGFCWKYSITNRAQKPGNVKALYTFPTLRVNLESQLVSWDLYRMRENMKNISQDGWTTSQDFLNYNLRNTVLACYQFSHKL